MSDEIEEMTAPSPIAVGNEQSIQKNSANQSITEIDEDFNTSFDVNEMQKEMLRMMNPNYLKTVSLKELFNSVYKAKTPIIDGLLYQGTSLFVGSPKLGKSFLMLEIAYHVSTGTPLWGYNVHQGAALYLALEDDFRRLQKRLYRMFGAKENENLFFSISANTLGNGLEEQLRGFLSEHPNLSLVIIDTLQRVREVNGSENYSYASDYQIITSLKNFADSSGISVIIVHHTRKQKSSSDDKFEMISGTTGLMGAADSAFLLVKEKRTDRTAVLEVSGRDQQDQRLYLIRNEETLAWDLERAETELWKEPPEPLLEEIAKKITVESPLWQGTPTELCTFLGTDMKANALTMKLNVLASRLHNEYGICYVNSRNHYGRSIKLTFEHITDLTEV